MSAVSSFANTISSDKIEKGKVEDGRAMKLKVHIAPYGKEDSIRHELGSDCSMSSPVGLRTLVSVPALYRLRLTKMDVQSPLLQTGQAVRDVYLAPTREFCDGVRSMCLLLTAAYGLVNLNTKWQMQFDEVLLEL